MATLALEIRLVSTLEVCGALLRTAATPSRLSMHRPFTPIRFSGQLLMIGCQVPSGALETYRKDPQGDMLHAKTPEATLFPSDIMHLEHQPSS